MTLTIQGLVTSLLLHTRAVQPVAAVHLDGATSKWQTWGPYRPGLYFGVRPVIPETLLMGVMWANGSNRDSLLDSEFTHSTPKVGLLLMSFRSPPRYL